MGAIEQGRYVFDIEYSVLLQKGALHVYKDGEFVEEVEFTFTGDKPEQKQIETLIDSYTNEHPYETSSSME